MKNIYTELLFTNGFLEMMTSAPLRNHLTLQTSPRHPPTLLHHQFSFHIAGLVPLIAIALSAHTISASCIQRLGLTIKFFLKILIPITQYAVSVRIIVQYMGLFSTQLAFTKVFFCNAILWVKYEILETLTPQLYIRR